MSYQPPAIFPPEQWDLVIQPQRNLFDLLYNFAFMLVIVATGSVLFNRVEVTFMDTV